MTMTEAEARQAIVAEATSWIGTPYRSNAMMKGKGGGTDCAMFLIAVYSKLGLIPEFDPRPYSPQWHIHRSEELYLSHMLKHATEFTGPPKVGDVAMFKIGKVFAHGAIVVGWPMVIHALGNTTVMRDDISKNSIGRWALARVPQRFFTLWPEAKP